MTQAFKELGERRGVSSALGANKPRIVTLGGDHSLTLPALRALNEVYGRPIQVLHFDGRWEEYPILFFQGPVEYMC